ncbi:hypothetical protein B484DRAFT_447609 [Ochromonadaceae sp. CCMP2298]|nr:hypothetical protein B484DRAFT_447609 [Ochromonadaceae sp. CCMP2298]
MEIHDIYEDTAEQMHDSDDETAEKIAPEVSAPTVACRTLYRGRNYDWQTKINLHVHIIEHLEHDTLELVAFNTSSLVEAPRVYLRTSAVADRVDTDVSDALAEEVRKEFEKAIFPRPLASEIELMLTRNAIVEFVRSRIVLSSQPFTVEVKDTVEVKEGGGKDGKDGKDGGGGRAVKKTPAENVAKPRRGSIISSGVVKMIRKVSMDSKEEEDVEKAGHAGPKLLRLRPKSMTRAKVTRYGKSATLVGDVSGVFVSKEERLLLKVLKSHSAAGKVVSASKQAVIRRLSQVKRKSKTKVGRQHFVTFSKFRTDHDLLLESLSFIHISDFLLLQQVSRTWHSVLSGALRSMAHMSVTSRDVYNREMRKLKPYPGQLPRYVRRSSRDHRDSEGVRRGGVHWDEEGEEEEEDETYRWGSADPRFKWRDVFVDCATVKRVVFFGSRPLTSLHLHYVVLNADIINNLSRLSGRLKKLSLGVVKMEDEEVPRPQSPKEQPLINFPVKATPPGQRKSSKDTAPTARSVTSRSLSFGKGVLHGKLVAASIAAAAAAEADAETKAKADAAAAEAAAAAHPELVLDPVYPHANLRYLNGADVKKILHACGNGLTHLSLSVTVGDMPPDAFRFCPNLETFNASDSVISETIVNSRHDYEGYLDTAVLVEGLQNIPLPDLLCMMKESPREAMLLLDKRGNITVANQAWEKMTSYSSAAVEGSKIDFLQGDLTDLDEFARLTEAMKHQISAESVTTFLHRADGTAFLAQLVFIPNVSKFRGLPLASDCLTPDALGQMALELQKGGVETLKGDGLKGDGGMKEWLVGQRQLSYHFIRFGYLSEPFDPLRKLHPDWHLHPDWSKRHKGPIGHSSFL